MWPFDSCFPDNQIQAPAQPIQPKADPLAFITEEDKLCLGTVVGQKFAELQMKIDADSEKINYRKQEEYSYTVALTCLIAAAIFCVLLALASIVTFVLAADVSSIAFGGILAYFLGFPLGALGGAGLGLAASELSDDAPGDNPFVAEEKELDEHVSIARNLTAFSEVMEKNALKMDPATNSRIWDADELHEMREKLALNPSKKEEVFQAHKNSYVFACPALSPEILNKISDVMAELP